MEAGVFYISYMEVSFYISYIESRRFYISYTEERFLYFSIYAFHMKRYIHLQSELLSLLFFIQNNQILPQLITISFYYMDLVKCISPGLLRPQFSKFSVLGMPESPGGLINSNCPDCSSRASRLVDFANISPWITKITVPLSNAFKRLKITLLTQVYCLTS